MLRVLDLQKSFGAVTAVHRVSFTAPDGAITGLLGANGAGKTTTLAMICALVRPDAGGVETDGGGIGHPSWRSSIGALLDHRGLYGRLTVRENIGYHADLQGLRRDNRRRRVEDTLARLGLASLAERRATGLSQGERLKVALARAIVHEPQHLLLDEPTNGLDVPTVRHFRTVLRAMRDEGRCIIFSSHVLDEVRALCDRIVVIAHGRVIAEDTVEGFASRARTGSLEEAFVTAITEPPAC